MDRQLQGCRAKTVQRRNYHARASLPLPCPLRGPAGAQFDKIKNVQRLYRLVGVGVLSRDVLAIFRKRQRPAFGANDNIGVGGKCDKFATV